MAVTNYIEEGLGTMKCKVEKFEVEKSLFRIWKGGGGLVNGALEESCGVGEYQGIHMKGDNGSGWEVLRRAILSVQVYSDQVGEERKKIWKMGQSRNCECKEKVQDWTDEGMAIASRKSKMVTRAGESFSERKACSPKKMVAKRKYVYSWKIQKGLVRVERPSFSLVGGRPAEIHLEEVGEVTEVARETVKLLDLTKVKLWVEMHPSVVLPACSRWKTGPGNILGLRGSIRGNECYRRELLPRARHRRSSKSMAAKRENGWEGRRLGLVEEVILGPTGPESSTKAHPVRAQKGRRNRGLHAGPDVPQAHDAAASLSSPQRAGSSAKATTQPRSGDERAGVEVNLGEDGWADEFSGPDFIQP
ncbi:hypothetical protein CK203_095163 [Vitis vinifera]|uniref:DUF4283 domain-containing protein n=1 Tax=Vitis vinifera TaxID=29760 RepID=A0A438C779_VITVI|nr:hypothetical protein CK203_095163 [Vitis vinifera]